MDYHNFNSSYLSNGHDVIFAMPVRLIYFMQGLCQVNRSLLHSCNHNKTRNQLSIEQACVCTCMCVFCNGSPFTAAMQAFISLCSLEPSNYGSEHKRGDLLSFLRFITSGIKPHRLILIQFFFQIFTSVNDSLDKMAVVLYIHYRSKVW